jgi:hypothetical protein
VTVVVACQRTGCDEVVEADWSSAPKSVREFALRDSPEYSELLYVYLPRSWAVDRVGHDEVIHCPEHADERGS